MVVFWERNRLVFFSFFHFLENFYIKVRDGILSIYIFFLPVVTVVFCAFYIVFPSTLQCISVEMMLLNTTSMNC